MIDEHIIQQVDDNGIYSEGIEYFVNAYHWNRDKIFKECVNELFKLMLNRYSCCGNIRVNERSHLLRSSMIYCNHDFTVAYTITFA